VLWIGATYGLSWLVTQSTLFRPLRERVADVPFAGKLLRCITCTSGWVALGLLAALPATTLFTEGFRVSTIADAIVLVGFTLTTTWALARALGDAD
jgi:hypothetical protein